MRRMEIKIVKHVASKKYFLTKIIHDIIYNMRLTWLNRVHFDTLNSIFLQYFFDNIVLLSVFK